MLTPAPLVRGVELRFEGAVLRVGGSGVKFEEPVMRLVGVGFPLVASVAEGGIRIPPGLLLLGSESELGGEGAAGSPEGVLG